MTSQLRNPSLALATAAAALFVSGCNVGPKYVRPQVTAPPTYRGADEAAVSSDAKDSLGDQQWATVFREPELQQLIRTALDNNLDLGIAARRVLESAAQLRESRAALYPTLSAGGTGLGAGFHPESYGNAIDSPLVSGGLSLSGSWTPDFWGQYRKQAEASRAQLLEQKWAQRAVRISLVQEVATYYIELRALDRQLEISRETVKLREDSLKLTRALEQSGRSPLSDVRQAEESLYTATAEIPALQQSIQQDENALRLLLGQEPGPVAHTAPNVLSPVPENLPAGLPSQLLERRPDIQEAEAQLIAANAQIGVARAQMFPSLSISAYGGVSGSTLSSLFDTAGGLGYGLGQLTQPIFEGGKLRAQVEYSKQYKEELLLNYRKTILGAFRDVSNALIAVNKQRVAREEQEKLVTAAKDASRLAHIRYEGGSISYLEVLTTDATLFSAQLNLVTAQQNEALTLVQLYNALGGGWQQ
jgi:outer membrane protein, multidrug efflux system